MKVPVSSIMDGSAMSARAAIINAVGDTYSEMPIREVMRGSDAILSALRSAGFAVVPVEPTNSMELAASEHDMNEIEVMRKIWRAMLSASEGEP